MHIPILGREMRAVRRPHGPLIGRPRLSPQMDVQVALGRKETKTQMALEITLFRLMGLLVFIQRFLIGRHEPVRQMTNVEPDM